MSREISARMPDELVEFVEEKVSSDGYQSNSEYLRKLVRDAMNRENRREEDYGGVPLK